MSEWTAKRFWTEATITGTEGAWQVLLDGRGLKTPGKTDLTLPTEALARAVAAEWDAQTDVIDPRSMPFTRMANSAHDKVAPQHAEVAQMLAAYGANDLLCYRAADPAALRQRLAQGWDPVLDWAAQRWGLRLNTGTGVMHVAQPDGAVEIYGADLFAADSFALVGLHDLITISGSLILALAVLHGHLSAREAWDLCRIDEDWQAEQWGIDADAAKDAAARRAAFLEADQFLTLVLRDGGLPSHS